MGKLTDELNHLRASKIHDYFCELGQVTKCRNLEPQKCAVHRVQMPSAVNNGCISLQKIYFVIHRCAGPAKKAEEKIPKKFEIFREIADFGSKPASLVLLVIISAKKSSVGKTDLTRLLDELETFPIALNEALFEGYKCPSKVVTLKIVLGGLPHL